MHISFSPQRRDDRLELEKSQGDRLRINGELFNFNPLPDGGTIPAGTIPCEWIIGPVERINGDLHVTLVLPHGPNPIQAVAFPQPITVTADGPIAVPEGSDPIPPSPPVRTDEEYQADLAKQREASAEWLADDEEFNDVDA